MRTLIWLFLLYGVATPQSGDAPWWRALKIGVLPPGPLNAITDVAGVQVGQVTLIEGQDCRTGVTAILPHPGNVFQEKVPAAIYVANGFGKLTGVTQVEELGTLETPIVLTNTLSVPVAARALIRFTLEQTGNEKVRSVNPVVGETNDGFLNNIRAGYVTEDHVLTAIGSATSGPVAEGNVGAGTGTICFGFKGGIGTASRKLPEKLGGHTVGVLVQTNFGGILHINGAPVGEELRRYYLREHLEAVHDGSCMIVVATDAPLDARQLKRLARRALYGLVRTGGISTHGSGDYVIAFSTAESVRYPYQTGPSFHSPTLLRDEALSPLFLAAIEATEEAIYHSLFAAEDMKGHRGHIPALPEEEVKAILEKYGLLRLRNGQ
ncbi:MAG: S58 family peptidase [Calditrichaeota bacterium]|nr:MAG: S58 family peptidase [Calditrichota bacterium]